MFHLTILASGSAGNCALVESDGCRLLIDGGLSARQMAVRLAACGVAPESIDGIVLTHEHCDHTTGLDVWCDQFSTPVYCNRLTAEVLRNAPRDGKKERKKDWRTFLTGSDFCIGDISLHAFSVPHDAADPCGFILHCGGASLGFLTDLGFATRLACERVREVHTLLIETNHDEKLLQNDLRRPWPVKQRIMSRHGHLSNAAAAEVVAGLGGNRLRRVILGHLSRDCNTPELALAAVRGRLQATEEGEGIEVSCATHQQVGERMQVGPAVAEPARVQEQAVFWSDC
jgi:phosphoribosyl 1,2-cyclic phosphodiesterase